MIPFEKLVAGGAMCVVALAVVQTVRGNLESPAPCIQVPAFAHQDLNGYWWAGTIGPYGWSYPGTDDCIEAVDK